MSTYDNPFEELQQLFERMNYQFQDSMANWSEQRPFEEFSATIESMPADVLERDEEYVVHVDLPGFDIEAVDVAVTDSTLRIVAEREESIDESEADYVRRERHHARAERSIRLPTEIDADAVEARMKNGVLTVTLPKDAETAARQVEIEIE